MTPSSGLFLDSSFTIRRWRIDTRRYVKSCGCFHTSVLSESLIVTEWRHWVPSIFLGAAGLIEKFNDNS